VQLSRDELIEAYRDMVTIRRSIPGSAAKAEFRPYRVSSSMRLSMR
jgi:hypothetical protein